MRSSGLSELTPTEEIYNPTRLHEHDATQCGLFAQGYYRHTGTGSDPWDVRVRYPSN